MALMFPRLAQNFARNGYYPTDEVTLERTLSALKAPESGQIRLIDPCAGEGVAIAECAHWLGRHQSDVYAIEYDHERAEHCRTLVDRTLRSDFLDTMVSKQSFGLLFLNPPYGDLPSQYSEDLYTGTGRKRLEKLFYQKTYPLLQYGGVLVLIVPYYTLDEEFSTWISHHFSNVQVFYAPEEQFKQVVIFGVRTRGNDRNDPTEMKKTKERLMAFGEGNIARMVATLPEEWLLAPYIVPNSHKELEHFFRVSFEPEQFAMEVNRLVGLWPEFKMQFTPSGLAPRQPARQLSPWHLALSLAAGAISGVVKSQTTGKTLIVKGNTHKEKTKKVEYSTDDDGNITEIRTMIDKFVPVIKAWDMTEGSKTYGCVLTITSKPPSENPAEHPQMDLADAPKLPAKFSGGQVVATAAVDAVVSEGLLNIYPYLSRHFAGDWGDICAEDKAQNDHALKSEEERMFSSYDLGDEFSKATGVRDNKLWIITEWDRSVTTVLFPSDY